MSAADRSIRAPWIRWRLRRKFRKSQRKPPTWPSVLWFCACFCATVAALVALAFLAGRTAGTPTDAWDAVLATLAKPAVALGVGAVLVLAIAEFFRRIFLEFLVWWPGAIRTADLQIPDGLADLDGARLSGAFRQRLQELRLQAPAPIPGAIPSQDFLQMLDPDGLDAKNPLASAVRILRAAVPDHAYEVSAALVTPDGPRDDGFTCGVTAQLTRLPHEVIPVETAWAPSWEAAVVQSADMVTAAVLPMTRLSKRAPWSGWRRFPMPSKLVYHFEQAEGCMKQRRYDEALSEYYAALELDPKSVDLRLQLGFAQEKLRLYLDAMATYAAAMTMATKTERRLYGRRGQRDREASGRTARYRLAVLLSGPKLAHQWRKRIDTSFRDQQRVRLHERLKPRLVDAMRREGLIRDSGSANASDPPPWKHKTVTDLLASTEADDTACGSFELRNVFLYFAESLLEHVQADVGRQWRPRTFLSPLAVTLTADWVELRHDWIKHKLAPFRTDPAPSARWVPSPEQRVPSDEQFRTWTEHYNAACIFAMPLFVTEEPITADPDLDAERLRDLDEERRRDLAAKAIEHLASALSCTTSQYVALRRDWLLIEDPDLVALRARPEFKQFESDYFPSAKRSSVRPENVSRVEQSRYVNALLAGTARRWEGVWHRRRAALVRPVDPHTVLKWCKDEADAWKLVKELTDDYRDWPARYRLIERMLRWSADYGFAPLGACVPRFAWQLDSTMSEHAIHHHIKAEITANSERLRSAGAAIGRIEGTPPQLELLEDELRDRDFWNRPTPRLYLPYVCDVHAAMWQRLHEWMEAEPGADTTKAGTEFERAVRRAGNLSSTATRFWLREALERRLHGWPHNGAHAAANGAPARAPARR